MQEQQPGQVITPGSPVPQPMAQPPQPEIPETVVPEQPKPTPQPMAPTSLEPQGSQPDQPSAPLAAELNEYVERGNQTPQSGPADGATGITWTSAEFFHQQKTSTWYGAYALGAILVGAILFFITRDIISTVVVIGAMGGLLFISAREPKQQTYILQEDFVQVGNKAYSLHDFKAFSVDEESPVMGVTLLPLKRFMPPVVLYVDEAHEEAVVDYIADFLPIEPHKVDAMDSLLRRLRF